jgi:hypothetical protein
LAFEFRSERNCMFLNEYSIVKKAVSLLILTLVHYFLFCMNIYMKKEAWVMEKAILVNIPDCVCAKVRPSARPDPSCRPSGQPGGQEKLTGQKSWPGTQRKRYPERES